MPLIMSDDQRHNDEPESGSLPRQPDVAAGGGDEQARLSRRARQVIYRTPEIRPEKVARLKEAIERGAYKIDSGQLADKIIREWFLKP